MSDVITFAVKASIISIIRGKPRDLALHRDQICQVFANLPRLIEMRLGAQHADSLPRGSRTTVALMSDKPPAYRLILQTAPETDVQDFFKQIVFPDPLCYNGVWLHFQLMEKAHD